MWLRPGKGPAPSVCRVESRLLCVGRAFRSILLNGVTVILRFLQHGGKSRLYPPYESP